MNRKLRDMFLFVATCLTLLYCIPSFGQVIKGSISGTAVDQQGAVVAGAQVKATDTETGVVLTTTTDNSGSFHFNLIPVGNYKVEISAQGFKTAVQAGILVAAGRDSGVGTIKMTVGEASTTVEVTSEAPLIESTQAQVTNTFSGTVLQNFAGVQENQGLDNLALFVPGVVSARDQGFSNTNGGGGFSVNGLRGRNNDQEIDGQNNNDNSVAGPALFVGDPEFVGQYVIITNNFGPEYGRNAGSVVNLITKSGTNAWHGAVYMNENNSILNSMTAAQNFNGLTEPPRSNDEFGGFTIGGPLVKNRAFFFGGFDQEILSASTVNGTSTLTPTPTGLAQLAACFSSGNSANAVAALSKFGPYGISAGNPTPLGTPVNTEIDDPLTGNVLCPAVEEAGVTRTVSTPFHGFNFINREDVNLGANDNLNARYIFNRGNSFNNSDNGPAGYFFNVPALSQAVLLSETHNFSSNMVNEVRVGFDRLNVEFGGNSFGTSPTTANILDAVTNVSFQDPDELGFGVATNLPQGRVVNTWQAQDNWNYVWGKHTIKAGVNFTHQQSPNIFLPTVNGAYNFADLAHFVVNDPTDCDPVSQADCTAVSIAKGNVELGLKENDTFFYLGDDWKIGRNLTLNLGVTYSYYGSPYNQLHDIGVANQAANPPLWDPTLPTSVTIAPKVPAFTAGIGPSFGFAYNPQWGGFLSGNGKTTIRGGYRLSYDPSFYNILLNNYEGAPSVLQTTFLGGAGAPSNLVLPAVPTGPNVTAQLNPLLPLGQLDPRNQNEATVPSTFRPDQVSSWSLGVERELSRNSAVEVRYAGNHGSQLFQSVNANPFIGDLVASAGLFPNLTLPSNLPTPCPASQAFSPVAVGREDCNQGIVLSRNNSGFSNYHALQAEFRANNIFHQLTVRAGYTHSKTLDNVSEIFSTFGGGTTFALAQNPLDPGSGEYSFSGLDIPNTFTASVVEQIPIFKEQHGFVGHVLGGWSLSGSYVWESGQPFSPETIVFSKITNSLDFNQGDFFDNSFNAAFNSNVAPARPFLGNKSAPVDSVGMFQGDACLLFAAALSDPLCSGGLGSTNLISLNNINATQNFNPHTYQPVSVTNQQVRYIANTGIAAQVFGTPFGNAPRNDGRDAPLNYLNASVTKMVKFNERASFEFRFTALNALNHANFVSVNPFVENAGTGAFGNAFALPNLTSTSIPGSNLAASRRFYVGGIFRF